MLHRVANNFLSRYKNSAYEISLSVLFNVGTLIEVGDIVALQDDGTLFLTNFGTGERDLGTQLYEVTYKSLNILNGDVQLKLTSGVQGTAADRFGTVAPSSIVNATTSAYIAVDISFAPPPATDESYKWIPYIGLPILVHDNTWTNQTQVTLTSVDNSVTPTRLYYSGTLGYSPAAGDIVDIPYYPTSTVSTDNLLYKLIHAFLDPTVPITGATTTTAFTVSGGNIGKFLVGALLYVRDATFTNISSDVTVTNVDTGTNTVTVTDMGLIPSPSFSAELVGFADSGAGYRIF